MARDDELMSWPYKLILLLHIALVSANVGSLSFVRYCSRPNG